MTDDLQSQLTRMPKPAVADVVTSVGAQAKVVMLTAVAMWLLAAGLYGVSLVATRRNPWEIAAAVTSALSFSPLLAGALMWLWVFVQGRKRRELAAGEYYVHWQYEPEQWAEHCGQHEQRYSRGLKILTWGGLWFAVVFAAMVHFDDDTLFFGSILTHYGLCGGIGLAGGWVIGSYCQYLGNITRHLQQTYAAQSIIGPEGVYITGQFWPSRTFGHNLRNAKIDEANPERLRFLFDMRTNHGTTEQEVIVPIPPGQEAVAEALVDVINE